MLLLAPLALALHASLCPDLLGVGELGHGQKVGTSTQRGDYSLRLVSETPPIWTIADFLSAEECDVIKASATPASLAASKTNTDHDEPLEVEGEMEGFRPTNMQGQLNISTGYLRRVIERQWNMPRVTDEHAAAVLRTLDRDGDGSVQEGEWSRGDWRAVAALKREFAASCPQCFARYSRQTWSDAGPRVTARIAAVLGLPPGVENGERDLGERLQVVRYTEGGRYTCHHDSSGDQGAGLRRAYTVLMQLNDVGAAGNASGNGGATWFPLANTTVPVAERGWGEREWDDFEFNCTRDSACRGGLVLRAQRGTAVIWANHRLLREGHAGRGDVGASGVRVGGLDWSTLHAGCDVGAGAEKWIANQWVWSEAVQRLCGGSAAPFRQDARFDKRGMPWKKDSGPDGPDEEQSTLRDEREDDEDEDDREETENRDEDEAEDGEL
eukprot:g3541.t1